MHDDGTPPLLTVDGGVATITLNRPRHHNRLHDEDLRALIGHVQAVDRDPAVRVLVLAARVRSDAPVFSAGFHVGAFGDDAGAAVRAFAAAADAVAAARPVTMAALNGSVYGGATDLALACDFRLGVEGMELRMPAAALGLHYYPSGLRRAVATIGLRAAQRLFCWGSRSMLQRCRRWVFWTSVCRPRTCLRPCANAASRSLRWRHWRCRP